MTEQQGGELGFPVRVVAARTGLTADVLRAWERRYGAVRPRRSPGGQRLYSEEDVARLTLMRHAALAGHSVAAIARLDLPALEALLEEPIAPAAAPPEHAIEALLSAALAATERLDATALESVLKRGVFSLGGVALVDHVVSRFLQGVGERWHDGALSPAHEHLASSVVRRVLAWVSETYAAPPHAPRIIVATPAGELHEFGAMLAATAAAEEGWQVVYLGASLPASHLVQAADQVGARAVALSLVHAGDDTEMHEVRETARLLRQGMTLLVGGAAAERHRDALAVAGIRVLPDIASLRRTLRSIRNGSAGAGHTLSR